MFCSPLHMCKLYVYVWPLTTIPTQRTPYIKYVPINRIIPYAIAAVTAAACQTHNTIRTQRLVIKKKKKNVHKYNEIAQWPLPLLQTEFEMLWMTKYSKWNNDVMWESERDRKCTCECMRQLFDRKTMGKKNLHNFLFHLSQRFFFYFFYLLDRRRRCRS